MKQGELVKDMVNKVVELNDSMESFYSIARGGWRGLVTDAKVDEDGFDLIYVKWDRDHWRWQPGQGDGWTYPGHFTVVGDAPEPPYTAEALVKESMEIVAEEEPTEEEPELDPIGSNACPHCGEDHDDESRDYMRSLYDHAVDEARDSEGFVLIWISRNEVSPGVISLRPNRISAGIDLNAVDLLEAEAMDLAHEIIGKAIQERMEQRNG